MQFIMKNYFSNVKLFFQWVTKKNNSDFWDGFSRLFPSCPSRFKTFHFPDLQVGMIVAMIIIQSKQSLLSLRAATTKFHYGIARSSPFEI
jgi:hypothetical protein